MAGKNRAYLLKSLRSFTEAATRKGERPCIFLSHISIDKQTAKAIGDYITDRGDIDIYLDIYDEDLQRAVALGNAQMITKFIEEGLEQSTHVMCLVSKSTISSWWVPYELGFGKRAAKELSTLALKDVDALPAFLSIGAVLEGTKSLNAYLEQIASKQSRAARILKELGEGLIEYNKAGHPLDGYLNWQK